LPDLAILCFTVLYTYQESVSDIPVAIIDNDASAYSRKFSRELDATKEVQLRSCINMDEAEYLMGRRKVHAIIVLPKDFEKTSWTTRAGYHLRIYVNMTSFFVYKSVAFAINFT
jgi:hypothetical protein